VKTDHALIFLLSKRKNSSVPVCSQFSKESRWGMMQCRGGIQLRTSVEKSEARNSDVNPRRPMTEMVRLGS